MTDLEPGRAGLSGREEEGYKASGSLLHCFYTAPGKQQLTFQSSLSIRLSCLLALFSHPAETCQLESQKECIWFVRPAELCQAKECSI